MECYRNYDVVVAGGGLGGVAAALAAARSGAKTLLIERNTCVGGTATAGMCCSIFNCYFTAKGELGTPGIPAEIADRLADAMGYGKAWRKHRGHIIYDLELGKLTLQRMLTEAGVDLLFQTFVTGVVMEKNRVAGVRVYGKSGEYVISARCAVDATGDADVAFFAGAGLAVTSPEKGGEHSLCFRLGNVAMDEFVGYFRTHPDEYPAMMDVEWDLSGALAQYDECGTFLFPHGGGILLNAFKQAKEDGMLPPRVGVHNTTDACQMHGMRQTGIVHVVTGFVRFDGLDAGQVSRAIIDGREMAFELLKAYRRYLPGFADAFVAGVADNLGVRTSRYLDNEFKFTPEMRKAGIRFPDAVAKLVPYENVVKNPQKRAWGVQIMGDDTFDLPLRALVPDGVEGLIMGAGRSISATNPSLLRVMVHTMAVGEAAGHAAALSATTGSPLRELNPADILNGRKSR